MAQPKDDVGVNLPGLFTELKRHGVNQSYDKALITANRILQSSPDDPDAYRCKIVCIIHLGNFADGLAELDRFPKLSSGMQFERAYIEYRLNKTSDAVKTLKSAPQLDFRCKELLAQLLYRLEDYRAAMDVYKDVLKSSQDDFDKERRTNVSAVVASLSAKVTGGQADLDFGSDEDEYELCYNAACRLIGHGDYAGAEGYLRRAEDLCRKSMEDDPDVTEEDIEEELSMIRVQLGYCLQSLGRVDEALRLYNNVLKLRPADIATTAVAANNVVSINKDHDIFDSKKKMKIAVADGVRQKLTSRQLDSIDINQCLLHLHSNQGDACRSAVRALRARCPAHPSPVIVEAAQFVRDKRSAEAIAVLKKYTSDYPACLSAARLTLAQLCLAEADVSGACDELRALDEELAHRPAVVSALVSLYRSKSDTKSAEDVQARAIEWYEKNEPASDCLTAILRASSDFHLKNQNARTAAVLLEKLRRKEPKSRSILGSLFAAYSQFDSSKAKLISTELPSIEALAADVDTDALESAVVSSSTKYAKARKTGAAGNELSGAKLDRGAAGDELLQKAKHKKKRKGKLPINYDANVDPDPERWLPRRERSYYKGKRKYKRKDIGKGSQGATLGSTDLDASTKPQQQDPSSVQSAAAAGGGGSGSGAAAAAAAAAAATAKPLKPPAAAQKKKKSKVKGGKW